MKFWRSSRLAIF